MSTEISIIPDEVVINKIYFLRNQKVMLDRDLATLYGIETRVLNKQFEEILFDFPKILCLN